MDKLLINLLNVELIINSWNKNGRYIDIRSYWNIIVARKQYSDFKVNIIKGGTILYT